VLLFAVAALVTSGLTTAGAARAQTSEIQAAAQKMFDDAKALMETGKYEEACALLEESQKIDPGMAAQFRLGECYEKAGRLASAWSTFVEVASAARAAAMADRERVARERAEALKPKLSYLAIKVPEVVAATPGLVIKRDGIAIGRPQWGAAVPVNSGNHAIEASAPDKKPWTSQVKVEPAPGTTTVTVPIFLPASAMPNATPEHATEQGSWSTQRTVALAVGGVGVVGVVLGSVFGVQAIGKNNEAKDHCRPDDPSLCDATGVGLLSDVETAGNVSTVAFVVGGAALAGGVVLFLTAPAKGQSKGGAAPRIEVTATGIGSGGGLTIRRSW
jgi:hypothetical protein